MVWYSNGWSDIGCSLRLETGFICERDPIRAAKEKKNDKGMELYMIHVKLDSGLTFNLLVTICQYSYWYFECVISKDRHLYCLLH